MVVVIFPHAGGIHMHPITTHSLLAMGSRQVLSFLVKFLLLATCQNTRGILMLSFWAKITPKLTANLDTGHVEKLTEPAAAAKAASVRQSGRTAELLKVLGGRDHL